MDPTAASPFPTTHELANFNKFPSHRLESGNDGDPKEVWVVRQERAPVSQCLTPTHRLPGAWVGEDWVCNSSSNSISSSCNTLISTQIMSSARGEEANQGRGHP